MTDDASTDNIVALAARQKGTKPAGDSFSEDAVALAFATEHADDSRYVAKWNRWIRWDGCRWRHEDTLAAFDAARVLCRTAGNAKAKTVAAVVTLARTDRTIAAREEQWDTGDKSFNIQIGKEI
jgi:phage/plasmid-associated DNA primase